MGQPNSKTSRQKVITPISAVVFDAVGTVMYPNPSVSEAYRDAIFRHSGLEISPDKVAATVREALRQRSASGDLTTTEADEHNFWADLIRQLCPNAAGFQACFDELFEHFAAPSNWDCFPEVAEVMCGLRDLGVRTAIASNFDLRLNPVCDGLPALDSVSNRIISSVVGWRKPAPQFFAAVCEHMKLQPNEILFVGDDIINDVKGAGDAGMQAVWINRSTPPESPSSDLITISSLKDLLTLGLPGAN